MRIRILAFGVARDILNAPFIEVDLADSNTVTDLKTKLEENFPGLQNLAHYRIALDREFALDTDVVKSVHEIAIIPPVSGG